MNTDQLPTKRTERMKEFKREYKWESEFEIIHAIGAGVAIGNTQPKKKFKSAYWTFSVIVLCFAFEVKLSYNYKP